MRLISRSWVMRILIARTLCRRRRAGSLRVLEVGCRHLLLVIVALRRLGALEGSAGLVEVEVEDRHLMTSRKTPLRLYRRALDGSRLLLGRVLRLSMIHICNQPPNRYVPRVSHIPLDGFFTYSYDTMN